MDDGKHENEDYMLYALINGGAPYFDRNGAYDGTDGEEVNGIATYKTVQAAVNSVAASNERRVVIFVKEGRLRRTSFSDITVYYTHW